MALGVVRSCCRSGLHDFRKPTPRCAFGSRPPYQGVKPLSWRLLEEEITRWREAGRTGEVWWRDDDAVAPTAPVKQLLELSARSAVPLALAVIPLAAKAELFDGMRARVLLHGTDHRNRAQAGHKKTEFAEHEPDDAALGR